MTAEAPIKSPPHQAQSDVRDAIPCINPATGESLGEVAVTLPEQVPVCVARARAAQQQWARSTFAQRRAVLKNIMEFVLQHADELCNEIFEGHQ